MLHSLSNRMDDNTSDRGQVTTLVRRARSIVNRLHGHPSALPSQGLEALVREGRSVQPKLRARLRGLDVDGRHVLASLAETLGRYRWIP